MAIYSGEKIDSGWTGNIQKTVDNGTTYTSRRIGDHVERHCDYDDTVTVFAEGLPGMPSPLAVAEINRSGDGKLLYGYELKAGMAAFMACFTVDVLHYLVTPVDIGRGNMTGFIEAIRESMPIAILCRNFASELFELPLVAAEDGGGAFEFTHAFQMGQPTADCPDLEHFETTYQIEAITTLNASFPKVMRFRTGLKLKRGTPLKPDTDYRVRNDVVFAAAGGEAVGGLITGRFSPVEADGRMRGPQVDAFAIPKADESSWWKKALGPKRTKLKLREELSLTDDGLARCGWRIQVDPGKEIRVGDVVLDRSHLVDLNSGLVRDSSECVIATFRASRIEEGSLLEDLTPSDGSSRIGFVNSTLAGYLKTARVVCLCYGGDEDQEFVKTSLSHMAFHYEPMVSVLGTGYSNLSGLSPGPGEPLHGAYSLGSAAETLHGLAKGAHQIFTVFSQKNEVPRDARELAYWYGDIMGRDAFVVLLTS